MLKKEEDNTVHYNDTKEYYVSRIITTDLYIRGGFSCIININIAWEERNIYRGIVKHAWYSNAILSKLGYTLPELSKTIESELNGLMRK